MEHGGGHHAGPTSWLLMPFLPDFLQNPEHIHVNAAIVVFLFITVIAIAANRLIKNRLEHHIIPSPKFGIVGVVDVMIEGLYGLVTGTLGAHGEKYFPFIASVFLFVLFGNLIGLLPHSAAATGS